ncbi:hypothetical protein COF50_19400 [Bacillus toyonensis]|uniref:Uncharacterized protein n=1 Tax=Bacillus toyonensis TaxID=155322 RepID=A0AAP8F758_9BACI|nr:hypothetical protein [Bacillus toyonensis]MBH0359701.1 hypothetical protein [Bacillus toyonensis biovar Thuringiensis]PEO33611.1 hypothetical protein CN569_13025 [Bacillus toyonensis]PGD15133.1 hypothetical protein COM35_16985 [Bacillus toyonensis]PHC56254.1 hypothetical protein COF08_02700 [Bacillus toyonensis]
MLYYYQDNILNNPQNKEMHIFLFGVVKLLKLSGGLYIIIQKCRLQPTNNHLPLKVVVLHLHIFEEGVFCWEIIKSY